MPIASLLLILAGLLALTPPGLSETPLGDALECKMKQKPLDALRGNCLGDCKKGMVDAQLLPDHVLRAGFGDIKNKSLYYKSHEGLFSDDLFLRPYAYDRLFEDLGINEEEYCHFISLIDDKMPMKNVLTLRSFIYALVLEKLQLPQSLLTPALKTASLSEARKIFYTSLTTWMREHKNRNLEFWNKEDKIFYNILFGEFNYAWMAVIDIFESEEFNPQYTNFKRIFPVQEKDLGISIYTPNKKGPEGSLELDLRNKELIPDNAIIVYRLGSNFTRGETKTGELSWESLDNKIASLFEIDNKPGHIECVTSGSHGVKRCFCSDGKKLKPATEWSLNREVLAIYVPLR